MNINDYSNPVAGLNIGTKKLRTAVANYTGWVSRLHI